jgi:FkbM family methyltransferase
MVPNSDYMLMIRHFAQNVIVALLRPYIFREMPGWGIIFAVFVGGYARNWFWEGRTAEIRNKKTGFLTSLDLSKWADRLTFFLGRWYSVAMQAALTDIVKRGDTIVDVGANRGNFSFFVSWLTGPHGKVIAFEPNPKCAEIFKTERSLNQIRNISLHECGLSNSAGTLRLTVPLINSGEATFGKSSYSEALQFEAAVRVGDDVLQQETPALIKIDVEGFETNVIRGLVQTINRVSPLIITEVISAHLVRAGSSIAELHKTMEALGYIGMKISAGARGTWYIEEFRQGMNNLDALWLKPAIPFHEYLLSKHTR